MSSSHTNPPVDLSSVATAAALTTAQADLTTLESRLTAARAGYLDQIDGTGDFLTRYRGIMATKVQEITWTSTGSGSWIDTGIEITTPNYAGETFTVVFEGAECWSVGSGTSNGLRTNNASLGAQTAAITYGQTRHIYTVALDNVPANTLSWLEAALEVAGDNNYIYGTVYMYCILT